MPQVQRTPQKSPVWIWISPAQVSQLSRSGTAWTNMKADADQTYTGVQLFDPDSKVDTYILAGAFVYLAYKHIATVDTVTAETYRAKVQAALELVPAQLDNGPFEDDRILPLARNITPLVIAASIIDWDDDQKLATFEAFCRRVLGSVATAPFDCYTAPGDGRGIPDTHEDRPNNWGTHAGAARVALARFLRDQDHLERAALVWQGWFGDRSVYADFDFGELSWQANSLAPVAINGTGTVAWDDPSRSFNGSLPEEQRRTGPYPTKWLSKTNYSYEALQGACNAAVMLARAGYPAWDWSDSALKRAFAWLSNVNLQEFDDSVNGTDDVYMAWLIDQVYGTTYVGTQLLAAPTSPGKAMGYLNWMTHCPTWP